MPDAIVFHEAKHRYTCGDRELPGITRVLKAAGLVVDSPFTAAYLDRGQRVHRGIEFALAGELKSPEARAQFAPEEIAVIDAAGRAVRDLALEIDGLERVVGSIALGYATKIDAIGRRRGRPVVLNWKGPSWLPHYPIQAAAEAVAAGGAHVARIGVHLRTDGSYRVHEYRDRGDFDVWSAALRIYGYVSAHKMEETTNGD